MFPVSGDEWLICTSILAYFDKVCHVYLLIMNKLCYSSTVCQIFSSSYACFTEDGAHVFESDPVEKKTPEELYSFHCNNSKCPKSLVFCGALKLFNGDGAVMIHFPKSLIALWCTLVDAPCTLKAQNRSRPPTSHEITN